MNNIVLELENKNAYKTIKNKEYYIDIFLNRYNYLKDKKTILLYNTIMNPNVKILIMTESQHLYDYMADNIKNKEKKNCDDILKKLKANYQELYIENVRFTHELTIPQNIKNVSLNDTECKKINVISKENGDFYFANMGICEKIKFNENNKYNLIQLSGKYKDITKMEAIEKLNCNVMMLYHMEDIEFKDINVSNKMFLENCRNIKIDLTKNKEQKGIELRKIETIEINNINVCEKKAININAIEINKKEYQWYQSIRLTDCCGQIILKNEYNKNNIKTICMDYNTHDYIYDIKSKIQIELYNFDELVIKIKSSKMKIEDILEDLLIKNTSFNLINKTKEKPIKLLIYGVSVNDTFDNIKPLTKEMLKYIPVSKYIPAKTNGKLLQISKGFELI